LPELDFTAQVLYQANHTHNLQNRIAIPKKFGWHGGDFQSRIIKRTARSSPWNVIHLVLINVDVICLVQELRDGI
jgi:hypothetical protein